MPKSAVTVKAVFEKKETTKDAAPKKGTEFTHGNFTYKITKATTKTSTSGTVTLTGLKKGKSITKLVVPKAAKYKGYAYNVTKIDDKAFYGNKKITSATIGNYVTSIGEYAFRNNTKLKTVAIGNKVTTISKGAFYKCTKLQTVTIGTGLKKIEEHAFCRDTGLRTMTIKSKKLTAVSKCFTAKITKLDIKVPATKLKEYKKLFSGKVRKSVKIVNY